MEGWQDEVEGNKANINASKAWSLLKILRRRIAEVELLHRDDPRILTKLPCQLIGPHIHCIDQGGSILEHDIRKASSRSPNIQRDLILQVNLKKVQGLF